MVKMKRRMGTRVPAAECTLAWQTIPPKAFVALITRMWTPAKKKPASSKGD